MRDYDLMLLAGAAVVFGALFAGRKALAYVNGKPVEIELGEIGGGLFLRADVAKAYNAMVRAAANDGVVVKPSGPRSAFRTPEMQASLDKETPALAAAVGYSAHQEGRAVDLETASGTNAAFQWLLKYAGTYGFVAPYIAKEPWHWEHPR